MALFDWHPLLIGLPPWRKMFRITTLLICAALMPGCGLIVDAVQLIYPLSTNELAAICRRGEVQVGMAAEPFRPFVFPAVWTDEGARVTGLDTELVRVLSDALTVHCGKPVVPQLHLVRFRDLFLLLSEGRLHFFVSAVAGGTPSPTRAGFAYSSPYFTDGGVTGIARHFEVLESIRIRLRSASPVPRNLAFKGLTIAVQDGTDAHWYAEAFLAPQRLILCDSLPAAFEYGETDGSAPIDVILGTKPVLDFVVKTTQRDWHLLTEEEGRPLVLIDAEYTVVLPEESYHLRWFINNVIFQLRKSGRLDSMRKRWLDESYAYPRRAATEGLSFDVKQMPAHYAQGTCREASLLPRQ